MGTGKADLMDWAQNNLQKAKDIATHLNQHIQSVPSMSGYTNSIVDILQNVKEVTNRMKFSDAEKRVDNFFKIRYTI